MKYQALKQLKTKRKLLKLCDTLQEAHDIITKKESAKFCEFGYIGGLPIYSNGKNTFSIQGLVEGYNIMCSLDDKEKARFNFNL